MNECFNCNELIDGDGELDKFYFCGKNVDKITSDYIEL